MEPSLTTDAESMIIWCLWKPCRTGLYSGLLGLPQSEHNKKTKGPVDFYGDSAEGFRALYKSTLKKRRELLKRFKTKQDLRVAAMEQRHTLISQLTEPLLAEFGPFLWSGSEPYPTAISRPDYPQYLVHNDSDDRERLVWNLSGLFLVQN
jgi:hypothetical protein